MQYAGPISMNPKYVIRCVLVGMSFFVHYFLAVPLRLSFRVPKPGDGVDRINN